MMVNICSNVNLSFGFTLLTILNQFDDKNFDENDLSVTHFINKHFNAKLPILDVDFLKYQVCKSYVNVTSISINKFYFLQI